MFLDTLMLSDDFSKKTRALGFSFAFSTLILFVGDTSLKHYYGVSISYDVNKKQKLLMY